MTVLKIATKKVHQICDCYICKRYVYYSKKKKSIILLLLGQLKFRKGGHVEVTAKLATGLCGVPRLSLPNTQI